MKTLLQQAKAVSTRKPNINHITDEEAELAMAWAKDEVSFSQVKGVIKGRSSNNIYNFLALALRHAIRRNGNGR